MMTSRAIIPGLTVKVFDPYEPPNEWTDFTVLSVSGEQVNLLSSSGHQTWAHFDEIVLPLKSSIARQ